MWGVPGLPADGAGAFFSSDLGGGAPGPEGASYMIFFIVLPSFVSTRGPLLFRAFSIAFPAAVLSSGGGSPLQVTEMTPDEGQVPSGNPESLHAASRALSRVSSFVSVVVFCRTVWQDMYPAGPTTQDRHHIKSLASIVAFAGVLEAAPDLVESFADGGSSHFASSDFRAHDAARSAVATSIGCIK